MKELAPSRKPLLVAHRGVHVDCPENSLAAFRRAFELGADGVELDVHLTADGKLMVLHHSVLDDEEQPIVEKMHSDRLATYPTLEQVLQQVGQLGRIEIEVKTPNVAILTPLAAALEKNRVENFELTTGILPLIARLSAYFPDALVGMLYKKWLFEPFMTPEFISYWVIQHLKLAGATTVHIDLEQYTPRLVDDLHAAGIITHTHLRSAEITDWNRVLELGIEQSTFDDPNVLQYR